MKITCPYCGNLFNDTLDKCPSCGAPNTGVVRKSGSQPVTIAELQDWYRAKGLPPYETTRFFIGENHKGPRAFGIYQDKKSGNFVVYKNKDNGSRAVRYEGTDEAYAVNEIYQRLKQEIIQQKSRIAENKEKDAQSRKKKKKSLFSKIVSWCIWGPLLVILLGICGAFLSLMFQEYPDPGYFQVEDSYYYIMPKPDNTSSRYWFRYEPEREDWSRELDYSDVPAVIQEKESSMPYWVSDTVPARWGVQDFCDSVVYQDVLNGNRVRTGYFQHSGTTYYHLQDSYDRGWYYFDEDQDDWSSVDSSLVPEDLQHDTLAKDFYYTPIWDSSTQIYDFTDLPIYEDYLESQKPAKYDWDDNDSDLFDWDSGDSWDSDSVDWDSDW